MLFREGVAEDQRMPVESLQIGDVVRVKPGERFAVDGLVCDGVTWADEATLTGESEPIHTRWELWCFPVRSMVKGACWYG
jgi:P-type E1-E2 ATPase